MHTGSTLTHLECGRCGTTYHADQLINLCPACSKPLLARYDLAAAARTLTPEALRQRPQTLWRYAEVLPVQHSEAVLNLGEGFTPLLHAERLAFTHPRDGRRLAVHAPGDTGWRDAIALLGFDRPA